MKKIFITGVAGFIGFSLANYLLSKKFQVIGVDNFDKYYSIKIKRKRIKILQKNKNFSFYKLDIVNYDKISKLINNNSIDILIHLAAQAGVRYSLINPNKYLDTNITGFMNLIKSIEDKKIDKFIYASSSSVYGDRKKLPLKEFHDLNPKNIYGLSKKINEEIANCYSKIYKTNFIGLRFFTIYGEWGRPDMFMLKLFKATLNKKIFELNNHGNHRRDFTYIGDAVKAVYGLIQRKQKGHNVYNICSNKPIKISKIINYFKKQNNVNVKLVKMHKADVKDTHGENNKLKKIIKGFKIENFYQCFDKTYDWYKKNNIQNIE